MWTSTWLPSSARRSPTRRLFRLGGGGPCRRKGTPRPRRRHCARAEGCERKGRRRRHARGLRNRPSRRCARPRRGGSTACAGRVWNGGGGGGGGGSPPPGAARRPPRPPPGGG